MEIVDYLNYKTQRLNLLTYTPKINQSNQNFLKQIEKLIDIPQNSLSEKFLNTIDKKYEKDTFVPSKETSKDDCFIKKEKEDN